jgi:hypothetical protein
MLISTAAETGAQANGDLYFNRFDDTGTYTGSPFWIRRSDGIVSIPYQARTTFGLDSQVGGQMGITINGAPSSQRSITWTTNLQTVGPTAASRWILMLVGTETGTGNAGADLSLRRYDDTGAFVSNALTVTRATGLVTMANGASITGATLTGGTFTGTFAGTHTYSGAVTLSGGGTLTGSFAGAPTFTGAVTFSAAGTAVTVTNNVVASGNILGAAGLTSGGNTQALTLALTILGTNASARQIRWYSDTSAASGQRWNMGMVNAETGSNTGGNFNLNCYDDTGAVLFTPINITRATGAIATSGALAVGGLLSTGGTSIIQAGGPVASNNVVRITPTVAGGTPLISTVGVDANVNLNLLCQGTGGVRVQSNIGFNNTVPIAKPTVTGAKGSNAALASLLTALAAYGLVTDSTTA